MELPHYLLPNHDLARKVIRICYTRYYFNISSLTMLILTYYLLSFWETIVGLPEDSAIICNYKYNKLFYPDHRTTLLDHRNPETLLEGFFPLELSSLRFTLTTLSNRSALLLISCQPMDPIPASERTYYTAFIIYRPLPPDPQPNWYWIRRIKTTDASWKPAFPKRWKRIQVASNANFTHLRLEVCMETALFLDATIEDTNPFGCRRTDTRGMARESNGDRLRTMSREMVRALEDFERSAGQQVPRRINRAGVAVSIYCFLGVVSVAAVVWLVMQLERIAVDEDRDREERLDSAPTAIPLARFVLVRHNTAPAKFTCSHI